MAFIGKGLEVIKQEAAQGSFQHLKLKDGESAIIRIAIPTDQITSVYEHVIQIGGKWHTLTCLGKKECPICATGDKASFVAYVPVIHRNDENKLKLFKAGKRAASPLVELAEEYGDLTERDFKVTRTGTKGNTQYVYLPRDVSDFDLSGYEIPDIDELVQPLSREALIKLLESGGEVRNNQVDNNNNKSISADDYPF